MSRRKLPDSIANLKDGPHKRDLIKQFIKQLRRENE